MDEGVGQLVGILYLHDYLLPDPGVDFTVPFLQINRMAENGCDGRVDNSCNLSFLLVDFLSYS